MGCGLSQHDQPINMRINILDADFLKKENDKFREKMEKLQIKYETYISMNRMIDNMQKEYRNVIVTTDEMLDKSKEELLKVNLFPNIFVKSNKNICKNDEEICPFHIKYFKTYDELISQLSNRTENSHEYQKNHKNFLSESFVTLKILRETSVKSSTEIEIIKSTLKSKNISFEIYQNFVDFQQSFKKKRSNFVVCDYFYHREVLNLIVDPCQTRVICMCSFSCKEYYDSRVYFLTDNWIEVMNEIEKEQKWSHLNLVKCSKVFVYSKNEKSLAEYTEILENFGFEVRIYCDLEKIMTESKHYFALSIIISPEELEEVELFLQNNDYQFKTKLITIEKGTENSIKSLRKIIKELKRGYRAKKSITRSIDIIDKNFENGKYLTVREEFSKSNIICHTYRNIDDYIYSHKYMSPYVVVNEEENYLLMRYMREIRSNSKAILFSRRHSLTSQVKYDPNFYFVSDHFGKIVNFVKSHPVYNPVIPDSLQFNELSIIKEQEQKDEEDFDNIDPTEIENESTELDSYKIKKYTTNFKKSVR